MKLVYNTCRPAYCLRQTCGKSVLGTKMLGNAVPERTTNFGWPAVQQVRDMCVYFLSSSFLLLPIFSSFSNNAARYDLWFSSVQFSSVQSSPVQSVSQTSHGKSSVNIERLGNMRFTTISLSSNVKNSLGVRHSFLCDNIRN